MGIRKGSRQRNEIIEVLISATDHPDAFTIYERVKKKIPDVSLATVYRNLACLTEEKEVLKLDGGKSGAHFDGNTEPHCHISCRICGRIDDIHTDKADEIYNIFKDSYDGLLEEHSLMFYGLCPECYTLGKSSRTPRKDSGCALHSADCTIAE